jgi:hypothetical protein
MLTADQKILVARLMANRDSLAATIGQIDVMLLELGVDVSSIGETQPAECPHPKDEVENLHSTLDDGPDDWICHVCGARQSEPFHPED